jgi:hypothetical protein
MHNSGKFSQSSDYSCCVTEEVNMSQIVHDHIINKWSAQYLSYT